MDNAFKYIRDFGEETEAAYPYKARVSEQEDSNFT